MTADLRPALKKHLRRFCKRLQNVQGDTSTKRVHTFRIACRELLACYPLMIAVTPGHRWHKVVRKALKKLNRLRDLQQMQERLKNQLDFSLVLTKKIHKAEKRWRDYDAALRAPDFLLALSQTEKSLSAKMKRSPGASLLLANSYQQWKKVFQRVTRRLQKVDAKDLETLHQLRVRYKELRYLLELWIEAGLSLSVDKINLKMWQELLGDVTDFYIMAKIAKKLGFSSLIRLQFELQAQEHAQQFLARSAEFSEFLEAIDQQVIQYFEGEKS